MTRFLLQRLGLGLITLVLLTVIVFATAEILPGDLGRTILGPYASQEQVDALNEELGTDRPLPERYASWLSGFVTGDWGTSPLLNTDVRELVLTRLKNSLYLGAFAFALIVPLSIALGVVAGLHYRRPLDRFISIAGLSLIALPEFVGGMILLVVFSVKLGWFPVSSSVPQADIVDVFRQFLLPAIPIMFLLFGYISRMARAGTIDTLRSNYVRTATLKGIPRRTVVRKHVLRNALLPTISVVSVQAGYLVGGLVVIETLFSYPGIGKLLIDSATGHDVTTLEAAVLMVGIIYLVCNLIADIAYALLNPRIRLA